MTVSVAEAKARLSALLKAAERGEEVTIARHGRPVVRLLPAAAPKQPLPLAELHAFRARQPKLRVRLAEVVRRLREEED